MARIRSRSWRRAGFTLIEMVIVLGIILLLAALLMGAVMKVMGSLPEVQTRTELSQLEIALNAFMADYSLDKPPPSYLMLREDMGYNLNPSNPLYALELQSSTFVRKAFGKNLGAAGGIDWNGDGLIETGQQGMYILEGEMCLVFYLSGIPNNWERTNLGAEARGLGFSANGANPAADMSMAVAHTGTGTRKGPYYTFPPARLTNLSPTVPFYVFIDPWKKAGLAGAMPYAYFSSNGVNNQYNQLTLAAGGDCASIQAHAWFTALGPTGPTAYVSPNRYQILSAGKDGVFGDGNFIGGSAGAGNGHDDQANFSARILGADQQ